MSRFVLSLPDAARTVILAFDTSGPWCTCAVLWADQIVGQTVLHEQKGQAESLMPLIQSVLEQSGIALSDLGGVAVGTGPGNFSGIRIAVSAARGLAFGLGIPAVGVSRFQADAGANTSGRRVMSVAAPRDQIYVQHLDGLTPIRQPELLPRVRPTNERPATKGPCLASCNHSPATSDTETGIDTLAARIAYVARRLLVEGNAIPRPAPVYVRAADAAPSRDPAPILLP